MKRSQAYQGKPSSKPAANVDQSGRRLVSNTPTSLPDRSSPNPQIAQSDNATDSRLCSQSFKTAVLSSSPPPVTDLPIQPQPQPHSQSSVRTQPDNFHSPLNTERIAEPETDPDSGSEQDTQPTLSSSTFDSQSQSQPHPSDPSPSDPPASESDNTTKKADTDTDRMNEKRDQKKKRRRRKEAYLAARADLDLSLPSNIRPDPNLAAGLDGSNGFDSVGRGRREGEKGWWRWTSQHGGLISTSEGSHRAEEVEL